MNSSIVLVSVLVVLAVLTFGVYRLLRLVHSRMLRQVKELAPVPAEAEPSDAFRVSPGVQPPSDVSPFELIREGLDSLTEWLAQAPFGRRRDLPFNGAIEALGEKLIAIDTKLGRMSSPFLQCGGEFVNVANSLKKLLPVREKMQPLLANASLDLVPDFDIAVNDVLRRAKLDIEQADPERCHQHLMELGEKVKDFVGLVADWNNLRQVAAMGIDPAEKAEASGEGWGWLRHGIGNLFEAPGDRGTMQQLVWRPWEVMSKPHLLTKITDWLVNEIKDQEWNPDSVCAMSSSGAPVATLLATKLDKQMFAFDDREFVFLPKGMPPPLDNVLLVDSSVQTGHHMQVATEKIRAAKGKVVGSVFICANDLLPAGRVQLSIVEEMNTKGGIIHLFEFSDLYQVWRSTHIADGR